ncbi:hypothetical protein GQ57_35145 [Burkholderia sp. MSh2]|uniref:PF09351 domain protein n=1 Tax=Burkholderia paludis TaxID=1506587 RepID=A0A6J5CY20_9BURK|nr:MULTISPECIES: DUF1993 domain-containing protein [Burkholderia]KEZ01442.1 hypothetical protein GQ57_35145 [Burkholderia sp. MSh2]KFG97345.1 hypothetical protein GQ56_0110920 [Burkholderia paludis]CAB3746493.1 hypothetical protein LMG30113_00208 [Burkholderia paludis]VWB25142.1 PF09351 domain protein [Burkholderia paludis]
MSPTQLLVPTFTHLLHALSAWLDKAAGHRQAAGDAPDAAMTLKLADDMYPLAAQVRFSCFQATEPIHRLRGEPVPASLLALREAGWNANAQPGTLADAQATIAATLAFLGELAPDALDGGVALPIALELPNGVAFDMTGEQYARDWALPQFYFHAIAAYAILRHHGVPLGKADFVPHMLAYVRPGTMPQG